MNSTQLKKISSVADKLRAIADDLNQLVTELTEQVQKPSRKTHKRQNAAMSVPASVGELKDIGREAAHERLEGLKQKDVAQLYIDLGGASRDKKRPKEWLIERILWQLFDFQSGHDILKDNR